MADRSWANTPELEALLAKALAHKADEWTQSSEVKTRTFVEECDRLIQVAGAGKRFVLDLDGTILFRVNPVFGADLPPDSIQETEFVPSDLFESRPVVFVINRKRSLIYFRRGPHRLLELMSKEGENTIEFVTHADAPYAKRMVNYLRRQFLHLRVKLTCIPRDQLKSTTGGYEYIVDDREDVWPTDTANLRIISSFTLDNIHDDFMLLGFVACLSKYDSIPFKVQSLVGEFAQNLNNGPIAKCAHCNNYYLANGEFENSCDKCGLARDS